MRDLWYFTKSNISLVNIRDVCINLGFVCSYYGSEDELAVLYAEQSWWRIGITRPDDFYEELFQKKLAEFGSYQGFHVRHSGLPNELKSLLRKLLENYAGWIGLDDEWDMVYTIDNISQIELTW